MRALIAVLLAAFGLVGVGLGVASAQPISPTIHSLELTGVVDPFVASYVEDGIQEARGDTAVIITIDTPGGLDSAMRSIVKAILGSRVPVLCFTGPAGARAASAGTFVMMACPLSAMAPGTNIGAAHPVGISGALELEKAENDAAAYIRSLAEQQDRNADWAERAVRESVSVSAEEALDLGVIDLVVPTEAALLRAVEGRSIGVAGGEEVTISTTGAVIERRKMGLGVGLLHSLLNPNLAFVFFYLGLALVIAEFFVPGGVLGVLGGIMLVLAVIALGTLPVQLVGVVLLVASVAFFLLELKLPGHAIGTGLGLACLVLGGLFLFDPSIPTARVSPWVIAPMALFAGVFFLFVIRAAIRMWRRPPVSGVAPLVGAFGMTVTPLDPTGIVQVASEEWTAESDSGPIPKSRRVRVVDVQGLRLRVTPVLDEPVSGAPVPTGHVEGGTE